MHWFLEGLGVWTRGVSFGVTFKKVDVGHPHVVGWAPPNPPSCVQGKFCTQFGVVGCLCGRGGGLGDDVLRWQNARGATRAKCPGNPGIFIS